MDSLKECLDPDGKLPQITGGGAMPMVNLGK